MHILVLGLGSRLRGDDAAGLEAVRLWREIHAETANKANIQVEISEDPGLDILDSLAAARGCVLVDAVRSEAEMGTIHRLAPEHLAAFRQDSKSTHGWGLAETLRLGQRLSPGPRASDTRLIGIEIGQTEFGAGLSQAVQESLPRACAAIQEEVESLLGA